MMELANSLKVALASSYVFYVKAQNFHWNVEGPDFYSYHKFLGKIYVDVYKAIDPMAELIRQLDEYTPGSMQRFAELSILSEQTKIPRAELMISELYEDNQKLLALLKEIFPIAVDSGEEGIADFIAGRIDSHGKWGWQLRSTLKKTRA